MEISYEEFRKVKIHVGTVKAVEENKRARKPALALEIDFGSGIGMKKHLPRLLIIIMRTIY